nr:MFS transporter [Rubricella aquisinus]
MRRAIRLGLPAVLLAIPGTTVALYLPKYFGLDMGLGLAVVGLVFAMARVVDILLDPVMGHLSDRTRSRFGPRVPWMLAALGPLLIASFLLTHPPAPVGLIYLSAAILLHYVSWTMLDIPFASIALETGRTATERVRLSSGVALCQLIGVLLVALVPTVLGLTTSDAVPLIPWMLGLMMVLLVPIFLPIAPRAHTAPPKAEGLLRAYRAVLRRAPIRRIVFAFVLSMGANAFVSAQIVLYVEFRVLAEVGAAPFFLIGFLASGLALPLVLWGAKRLGRKRTWQISLWIAILALLCIGTGAMIPFTIGMILFGASLAADAVIPNALLADEITTAQKDNAAPLAGRVRACKNASQKMTTFGPMLIGLPLLDWAGVDPGGTGTAFTQPALVVSVIVIPLMLKLGTLWASTRIIESR